MWSTIPSSHSLEFERQKWLATANESASKRKPEMKFSSHALLLLVDIEYAFRAGAWLSVIVLSYACVESTIRQIATHDHSSPSADIMDKDEDVKWLRTLRNEILHSRAPGTVSSIWKLPSDNIPACQAALEPEAKRAVSLAFRIIYSKA